MYTRNFKNNNSPLPEKEKKGEILTSKNTSQTHPKAPVLEERAGSSKEKNPPKTEKKRAKSGEPRKKEPTKNAPRKKSEPQKKSQSPRPTPQREPAKNPISGKGGIFGDGGITSIINRFLGDNGGSLLGLPTQDLLLVGLIFILSMEGTDDDLVLILLALLFVNSGEK